MPKQDFCSGVDLKSKLFCYHASGCKCGKFISVFMPLNTGKHINSVKYFSNTKASVSDFISRRGKNGRKEKEKMQEDSPGALTSLLAI
jgi:hypothetical protein